MHANLLCDVGLLFSFPLINVDMLENRRSSLEVQLKNVAMQKLREPTTVEIRAKLKVCGLCGVTQYMLRSLCANFTFSVLEGCPEPDNRPLPRVYVACFKCVCWQGARE